MDTAYSPPPLLIIFHFIVPYFQTVVLEPLEDVRTGPHGPLRSQTSALSVLDAYRSAHRQQADVWNLKASGHVLTSFFFPNSCPGHKKGPDARIRQSRWAQFSSRRGRCAQIRERRDLEVGHNTKSYMPGFQIPPDKADGLLWRSGVMRQPLTPIRWSPAACW